MKKNKRNNKKKKNQNIWLTNLKIQLMNLKLLLMLIQKAKLGKTDKEYCLPAKEVSMEDIYI
tara:strand:+ start:99 stop:284 length:186 start_codon:yes stop_codon:yes gene_type:complete